VIRHLRDKLACRNCDTVVEASRRSPDCPLSRRCRGCWPISSVFEYDDHLPLYRQPEIYARSRGVELETIDSVGLGSVPRLWHWRR